jgi:hypothetical protein
VGTPLHDDVGSRRTRSSRRRTSASVSRAAPRGPAATGARCGDGSCATGSGRRTGPGRPSAAAADSAQPLAAAGMGRAVEQHLAARGHSSWVRIFAMVDLPLPDWPTSPIVWRAQSVKLTSSSALMCPAPRTL